MRFLHLSDLHLGLRLHELSMLEEQRHLLNEVVCLVMDKKPDAVLICGDVYDKPVPPTEAVQLFDGFITKLSEIGVPVLVSSGNHDSAERLSFGSSIMSGHGVYFSPVYDGTLARVTLNDQLGEVDFFMLPFIKPANVRRFYPDAQINDYTDAVKVALDNADVDHTRRNVLLCHQNVIDPNSGESVVGGVDSVDASVFDGFDYVALGHIHLGYSILRDSIRYCGTAICYDFKQCELPRSIDMVTLDGNGECTVEHIPFVPLHHMMKVRGTLADLTDPAQVDVRHADSYLQVTLTDEEETVDAIGRLRAFYPLMLRLEYDNTRTRTRCDVLSGGETEDKSPLELFSEFYNMQNGQPMDELQSAEICDLINEVWGEVQ